MSAAGAVEQITAPDSALPGNHDSPTALPDGKTVLFTSISAAGHLTPGAVRLDERRTVPLVSGGGPTYLPGGFILFTRSEGTVSAVRFDARRLAVVGEPVTVLDSVATKPGGSAELAVAPNGTLVYLPGPLERELVAVDRRGGGRVVIPGARVYGAPRVSPDGRRIAVTVGQPPYSSDVWVYDIASATFTRLTSSGTSNTPEWTPDGRRVARVSGTRYSPPTAGGARQPTPGVWWQPWDASAPPELVIPGANEARFTPGGDSAIATIPVPSRGSDTRLVPVPLTSARPTRLLFPAATRASHFRLTPDGRWLAYVSSEMGQPEVFVQPFPGPGGRFQVSSGGGSEPVWAPSGKELFGGPMPTTFVFDALRLGRNRVHGHFYYNFRAAGFVMTGRVTCATVTGDQAWVGGVISTVQSADPADQAFVGTDVWWRVKDVSPFGGTPPDSTTSLLLTLPGTTITAESWCRDQPITAPLRGANRGDIKIFD